MYNNILKDACKLSDELTEWRRYLHQNAEVGFELKKTTELVAEKLKEMGYKPVRCGRAGVVADIGEGESCFIIRADTDALPMCEESGENFACKIGNMHACGHDMHTAMLLGAAKLLKAREGELRGRIRLVFQPAEEILEGAKDMIENGLLEGCDGAFMIHVASGLPVETGRVILPPPGAGAPSSDHFEIEVGGKSCHGSSPHQGVDALLAASHLAVALCELSARELAMSDRAILTVGTMEAGSAPNVIADRAVLRGTLRTFDEDLRERLKGRMCELANGIAAAYQATARVNFIHGCPVFVNNGELLDRLEETLTKLLGQESVVAAATLGGELGGSEDFAYVSQRVPTVVLSLAAGERGKGYDHPLHSSRVRFDESALPIGAAIYAAAAIASRRL